jgi:cytochrome d ubiquinol oxidase subunit I
VVSLLGFTLVYGLLGAVDFYLLAQNAKKGPVEESDAAAQTALEAATA